MRRFLPVYLVVITIVALGVAAWFNNFWMHRYDELIARQAAIYGLEYELVWSVIHEETYFQPWRLGAASEVGLMQVTPTVAREWARETGMREFERNVNENTVEYLSDPERNVQIGCWYLEKQFARYRDEPAAAARTIAAYNAGASRTTEWSGLANFTANQTELTAEAEFVRQIDIVSTREYVTSIMRRYRRLKTRGNA